MKRKHEEAFSEASVPQRRVEDCQGDTDARIDVESNAGDDFVGFGVKPKLNDTPFLGLLTQEEQDYYTNVNNKLILNDFDSEDDRAAFMDAVYRESSGKELKVASSQSSSRYLENIIASSSSHQVQTLFAKFIGHFTHLVQHRFASHCCEAIFRASALHLSQEPHGLDRGESEDDNSSFEDMFLKVVEELKLNLGYLLTEKFASHVVRVLLLVLSGEPLGDPRSTALPANRRKEGVEDSRTREGSYFGARTVPQSFKGALGHMIESATSTLNTTHLRALATHPTGNPVLQLLVRLELTSGDKSRMKDRSSVLRKLLPSETLKERGESSHFVQGIVYDPTGSRLAETLVQHVPGKMFKQLYRDVFKGRIATLAKNDISSYVAIKILERLGKDDLEAARDQISPEISMLVARNRINVITALVDRCNVRQVDAEPLAKAIKEAYSEDAASRLPRMLKLDTAPNGKPKSKPNSDYKIKPGPKRRAIDLHGSLLAQMMVQSTATAGLVHESLIAIPFELLLLLAKDSTASRIIQQAFTSTTSTLQFRRQLVPKFFGHTTELALDPSGSHVVDALWDATNGSHFMKERLARELQENERLLRESRHGRNVWRNWSMDMHERRFGDWEALAKGKTATTNREEAISKKSRIDIARERHATKKARPAQRRNHLGTVSASA
jgi:nucleolar protein 9